MRHLDRRIRHLEHYQPQEAHPARIPDWMRPWLDPLSVEDLEILEVGGFVEEAGGDPDSLSPQDRDRYQELVSSWGTFCKEHGR